MKRNRLEIEASEKGAFTKEGESRKDQHLQRKEYWHRENLRRVLCWWAWTGSGCRDKRDQDWKNAPGKEAGELDSPMYTGRWGQLAGTAQGAVGEESDNTTVWNTKRLKGRMKKCRSASTMRIERSSDGQKRRIGLKRWISGGVDPKKHENNVSAQSTKEMLIDLTGSK